MSTYLPITAEELLAGRVESTRLELKAAWDDKTGYAILKTICAFANDLYNLNGGYVIVGVVEQDGAAIRPVRGLPADRLDDIQKRVRGICNRIDPPFQPLLAPALVDERHVVVIHAPASETRPHHAPDGPRGDRVAWVRVGSETVKANKEPYRTLLYQQAAKVPFDDRRAFDATIDDLRERRVREFLRDVQSGLPELERDATALYQAMRLLRPVNGHHVPRNIGLLFFAEDPTRWFPGAFIDVVRFGSDDGTTLEERRFRGPLHEQVRACLNYLESFTVRHLRKLPREVEVQGFVSYPLLALREALVNAVYHRSYEPDVLEGTKVYLHPDRIEVISYPGPTPGLDPTDFTGRQVRPLPARNRRVGEMLKELRLAEARSTGIPKIFRSMKDNGSPEPAFDFDTERTYFRVTLPAHPEYVTLETLTDAAYLQTTGDFNGAIRRLEESLRKRPDSPAVASALIRALGQNDRLDDARRVVDDFRGEPSTHARVTLTLADVLIERGDESRVHDVRALIDGISADVLQARDAMGAAILARRAQQPDKAHQLFKRAGSQIESDAKMLDEFAQTKIDLVKAMFGMGQWSNAQREARERLLREAAEMLERVLQMDAPRERHAWAWYNLAWITSQRKGPLARSVHALEQAVRLQPGNKRFEAALARARRRQQA